MRYVSTRGGAPAATFSEAILRGLAPDGGLYLPESWPRLEADALRRAAGRPYAETVAELLGLFADGGLPLETAARAAAGEFAHRSVAPLVQLEEGLWLLELFHGPTAAFKDLAMLIMAALLSAALEAEDARLLLLTATSGDTGAAAAHAFAGRARVALAILHPLDRVSEVQRRQMTTQTAPNLLNLGVRGDFDDCQRLVKALLADPELSERSRVSSVNSVNWGRLLGQIPYFLRASVALAGPVRFVVPTGNFGDAFAGWAARRMGAPVGGIVAAVNANDTLARVLETGRYVRAAAVATASVSMDVAAPSNFERLVFEASGRDAELTRALFGRFAEAGEVELPGELLAALRGEVSGERVSEAETAATIADAAHGYGRLLCPHSAVAVAAARRLDRAEGPVVALATAHPAKFSHAVESALERAQPPAPFVDRLQGLPERIAVIEPTVEAAKAAILALEP